MSRCHPRNLIFMHWSWAWSFCCLPQRRQCSTNIKLHKETTHSSEVAFLKSNENTKMSPEIPRRSHYCTWRTTSVSSTTGACESHLLKHRAVILVSPDENLCDGADGLHKKISVVVCHCGVFGEDMVHIPAGKSTKCVDTFSVKGCS